MLGFFDQSAREAAALRHVLTAASGTTVVTARRERDAVRDGPEMQRLALQVLFRDAIITSFWKDAPAEKNRLVLLRDELSAALQSVSAVGLLADAFETADVTDSFFSDFLASPLLKLTPSQQVLIALSQCYAANEGSRVIARKWLLKRLSDVNDAASLDTFVNTTVRDDNVLRQLLTLTASDSSFLAFHKLAASTISQARAPPLPALEVAPEGDCVVSLSGFMEELGPACLATLDDARELLTLYPTPLTPKIVADCFVVLMTAPARADTSAWTSVRASAEVHNKRDATAASTWSALHFAQAVAEAAPQLDWNAVLASLDQPACSAEPNKIMVVLGAYRKATGNLAPLGPLLKPWTDAPAAQLQILKTLAANPDAVDRSAIAQLPAALLPAASTTDFTAMWHHPAFVAALLDCGAAGGNTTTPAVVALIQAAAKVAPAAIIASLIAHPPTRSARGLRLAVDLLQTLGLVTCLTNDAVAYIASVGHLNTLLSLLTQYVAADHGRAASVLPLLTMNRLFDKILAVASDPSVHVLFAISGQEVGQVPTNYIADALGTTVSHNGSPATAGQRPFSYVSNLPVSRVALAMAAVEVCDDLISKGSTISTAIRTALTAVANSGLSPIIPTVVVHAKSLMSAANAFGAGADEEQEAPIVFPADIESLASTFVESVCKGIDPEGRAEIMSVLKLREGNSERERLMISCICKTMMEEAACINQYPPSALANFARFFGQLVMHDLFSPSELRLALRIVLASVVSQTDPRMRDFGCRALEVFKQRLNEWPAFRNKLRQAPDLDMYVPGIIALLNSADREDAAKNGTGTPPPDASVAPNRKGEKGDLSALHQHDIRALMGDAPAAVAPSSVIQDRINFLVGNTDTDSEKTEAHATELRSLLRPEYNQHFAEYLVIKRVALEPNNHKTYLALIERLNSPDLDSKIRRATLAACKRLISSDKVCTNSGERSLLKNLGSWLGQITLAKNIPVLARDLDLRDLVPRALVDGKLIAVVPFVAKVIEHSVHSRAFKIPNPLIMCLLGQLAEMYRLDDLKITLRFEVEVLCRNLGIQITELIEYVKERPARTPLDDLKRRFVDIHSSFDFRPPNEEVDNGLTKSTGASQGTNNTTLKHNAMPFHPTQMPTVDATGRPLALSLRDLRTGREVDRMSLNQQQQYRHVLQTAFDRGLLDCQPVLERSVQIACTTTREIVAKDFCRDPDEGNLNIAAQAMARNLATNLVNVTTRDAAIGMCRKSLLNVLPGLFGPDGTAELVDTLIQENYQSIMNALEEATIESSSRQIEMDIMAVIEHRRLAARNGELFPRENIRPAAVQALNALPDALKSGRLGPHHMAVYYQFAPQPRADGSVEAVVLLLQQIEEAALRHYTECPPSVNPTHILSLTNVSFTETTISEHHDFIKKKLVEVNHWITEHNAVPLLVSVFPRIMLLAEKVQMDMRSNTAIHYVNLLLNEVCLFVLQAIREKGQGKAVAELTRLYLTHEKRWHNRDLATNLVRLRVIDIAEFDRVLARALQEQANRQAAVEFSGTIVQRCLIDEKLIQSKDLRQTLDILERIAEASKRQRLPSKVRVPTAHAPEVREQVELYFNEWLGICERKFSAPAAAPAAPPAGQAPGAPAAAPAAPDASQSKQVAALGFVKKLQDNGMLKAESMLDKFFGILTELAVEDYATHVLQHERTLTQEQRSQLHSNTPEIHRAQVQPPPSRVPGDPKYFTAVDAFSDLVVVLVKCCSWSNTRRPEENRQGAAESALITRVLHVVARTLQYNHDYFSTSHATEPQGVPEGFVLQDQFMQQPYMRFFSNLMLSLASMQQEENRPEYFLLIATALHATNPQRLPGFAFGWIELVCHRLFISRCLKNNLGWNPYFKLLNDALRFVEPFARPNEMSPAMILYFKCILKLMLLLLHDFAEFLLAYHQPLCDAIPTCCVQMRNIVLSAFPRDTKLPDPFARGTKYNQLPAIREPPTLVATVMNPFGQAFLGVTCNLNKDDFDRYIATKTPAELPIRVAQMVQLKLNAQGQQVAGYNVPMLSALILYSCIASLNRQQSAITAAVANNADIDSAVFNAELPAAELLKSLLLQFNNEGRYHVINACVNHLRFPNSHTHFFSLALQHLFRAPSEVKEHVQEIITRVLVERLIISRPHPWGLLVTFFDIVKDPSNSFWDKPFTRCTAEIERMFESVAHSVNPTVQQQAAAAAATAPPPAAAQRKP